LQDYKNAVANWQKAGELNAVYKDMLKDKIAEANTKISK